MLCINATRTPKNLKTGLTKSRKMEEISSQRPVKTQRLNDLSRMMKQKWKIGQDLLTSSPVPQAQTRFFYSQAPQDILSLYGIIAYMPSLTSFFFYLLLLN